MSKNWYAVYTKSQAEKKVVDNLKRKGLESFCPVHIPTMINAVGRKLHPEPLLKSFVFVKTEKERLPDLLNIGGVTNIVYWLGEPAVIRDVEIHMMRQFIEDHKQIRLEQTAVNTNEIVRIIKSRCTIINNNAVPVDKEVFKLILPSIGFILIAETDIDKVILHSVNEVFNLNTEKQIYANR